MRSDPNTCISMTRASTCTTGSDIACTHSSVFLSAVSTFNSRAPGVVHKSSDQRLHTSSVYSCCTSSSIHKYVNCWQHLVLHFLGEQANTDDSPEAFPWHSVSTCPVLLHQHHIVWCNCCDWSPLSIPCKQFLDKWWPGLRPLVVPTSWHPFLMTPVVAILHAVAVLKWMRRPSIDLQQADQVIANLPDIRLLSPPEELVMLQIDHMRWTNWEHRQLWLPIWCIPNLLSPLCLVADLWREHHVTDAMVVLAQNLFSCKGHILSWCTESTV